MEGKRADGVLVLGVIAVVFGVWSLFHDAASHLALIKNPDMYSQIFQAKGLILARFVYFGSIISLIIYPLFIISGFFILKLKNWSRNLLIFISVIQLVITLIFPYIWASISSSNLHHATVIPTPIPIIYITNIWFFNRKYIKGQFE